MFGMLLMRLLKNLIRGLPFAALAIVFFCLVWVVADVLLVHIPVVPFAIALLAVVWLAADRVFGRR